MSTQEFFSAPQATEIKPGDQLILARPNVEGPMRVSPGLLQGITYTQAPPTDGGKRWGRIDANGEFLDFWVLQDSEWRSLAYSRETRYVPAFRSRITPAYVGLEMAGLEHKLRVHHTLIAATPRTNDSDRLIVDLEAYGVGPVETLATETFGPFNAGVEVRREVAINRTLAWGQRLRFNLRASSRSIDLAGISVAADFKLVYEQSPQTQ